MGEVWLSAEEAQKRGPIWGPRGFLKPDLKLETQKGEGGSAAKKKKKKERKKKEKKEKKKVGWAIPGKGTAR